MKKELACVSLCMILATAVAQNEVMPLPKFTLNVNVAGILQMGPIIQTEFRLGKSSAYFVPTLRLPYAGLFYQLLIAEKSQNTVSPAAMGLGLQYKFFLPKKMGAFYFGGGAEYSFGASRDKDGLWEGKHSYFWVLANVGVRWRNPEKRTVASIGLLIGPSIALKDYRRYYNNPSKVDDMRTNLFLPMVEFSIGWER